jgi:hypothetical protein
MNKSAVHPASGNTAGEKARFSAVLRLASGVARGDFFAAFGVVK